MHAELRDLWYLAGAAFCDTHSVAVAYPNLDFDDAAVSSYIKLSVLSAQPEVINVCGAARHRFTLQASVIVRDGTGEFAALALVDALVSAFPVGHQLVGSTTTFEVQTPPFPAVPIALDGWFSHPVSIQIFAFD